jgi:hypothetical protein
MKRFWILSSYIVATAAAAAAVDCGQACALQHCPAIATGWGVRTHCFSPYNKPSNEQPPILAYGKTLLLPAAACCCLPVLQRLGWHSAQHTTTQQQDMALL